MVSDVRLKKGSSTRIVRSNIKKLINEGYGYKQAYAISYKKAGKYQPR